MDQPRPAGTVIPVRDGPRGIEVLVIRRAPKHRFLPGFVVVPGGAVEEGDADLAERWFGSRLEAARACSVRELQEEAGLVLTDGGSPPNAADLPEICHWIAPEEVPVRFDARFYALAVPRGVDPKPDGLEAERAWWARPADLLEAGASGGVSLYWPTMKVLEGLATCATVGDALGLRVPAVEPEIQIV
jgi:8-oxo-dGTP pyrophosphatase MutT (NUDIX family)